MIKLKLKYFVILIAILIPVLTMPVYVNGKKVKQSLKISKEKKKENIKKTQFSEHPLRIFIENFKDTDSIRIEGEEYDVKKIKFAGYEKEINSSKETFLIINSSRHNIIAFSIDIIYKDMDGRMLHKRNVTMDCNLPSGETKRFDISSWDLQRTYYYYLGNTPKKTATPYQVEFRQVFFDIDTPDF